MTYVIKYGFLDCNFWCVVVMLPFSYSGTVYFG